MITSKYRISFWMLPIFSALVWFGTLLAMLVVWLAQGSPKYPEMSDGQRIAYISDIGASGLKPLFIAGSAVSTWSFFLTFLAERWLRHKGRLAHNTNWTQKILSFFAILFALVGSIGLTCLTILDSRNHNRLHDTFLVVFIAGYIISAIFICAEYQRLGMAFREHSILAYSFWTKLAFIFIEVALAIAFGVMSKQRHYNTAAILEWIVSLIYIFYQASFALDFLPAIFSKRERFPTIEEINAEVSQINGPSVSGGPTFTDVNGRDSMASTQPMMLPTHQRGQADAPYRY